MPTNAVELAGNVLDPIYAEANADDFQDLPADAVRVLRTGARKMRNSENWRAR